MITDSIGIACHSFRIDGGMGRYVQLLTEGLNNLGVRPLIITKKVDRSLPSCSNVDIETINCKFVPSKLRDYYYNYRLGKYLDTHPVDIVISCNRNTHSDIAICGGTHIGYCRAMQISESFFDKKMIELEKAFYRNARLIVAHSEGMRQELIDFYGISPDKCPTIYPPVSLDLFTAENSKHLSTLQTENKFTFVIPSAGNHKMKGLDILINFFSRTSLPIKLLIAGRPISGQYRNVEYIGFRSDMPDVFRSVDFTILGSRYEAFGQVAIESVACGTPVVLSKKVCAAEVISDQAKFIFDENSFESFEKVIFEAIKQYPHTKIETPLQNLNITTDITQHVNNILYAFEERRQSEFIKGSMAPITD